MLWLVKDILIEYMYMYMYESKASSRVGTLESESGNKTSSFLNFFTTPHVLDQLPVTECGGDMT